MLSASELRSGVAIRLEGTLYKVLDATFHQGGGKMGGVTHARLQNLETGTRTERRFRADETVAEIEPERVTMQYLYADDTSCFFMHPETFEQLAFEKKRLGRAAPFLREGMTVPVVFFEGRPVGIEFPEIIEVRVVETAPPIHGHGMTNVWKEARLENGMTVMVPPFIAQGEEIRLDVETGKYAERAKSDHA